MIILLFDIKPPWWFQYMQLFSLIISLAKFTDPIRDVTENFFSSGGYPLSGPRVPEAVWYAFKGQSFYFYEGSKQSPDLHAKKLSQNLNIKKTGASYAQKLS